MSEFSDLKAEYKALTQKNPPPMSADALRAKIAELKTGAAAAVATDQPTVPAPADAAAIEGAAPSAGAQPIPDAPAPKVAGERRVDHDGTGAAEPAIDHGATAEADGSEAASLELDLAELGLDADADGNVSVEMLVSFAGPEINRVPGDEHRCGAAEAVRLVRAGFAAARG